MNCKMSCRQLRTVESIMGTLVDELKVTFNQEGMQVKAVDPAHVAMAGVTIDRSSLSDFAVEESLEIGVDLKKLSSFIRLIPAENEVSLRYDDNRLVMSASNITRRMAVLDADAYSDVRVPNLDIDSFIKAEASMFHDAIRGMKSIESDAITLTLESDRFSMASSNDVDEVDYTLVNGNGVVIEGKASAIFPTDYITNMFNAIPREFEVTVQIQDDYPVKLDFTGAGVRGFYLVAPRIESEDS